MTIEKAIIVDEAQLAALTGGGATWLMQKRRWNYRGRVGLVVRGSGAVAGVAEMAECLDPVEDAAAMAAAAGHHGLDGDAQAAALEAGTTVPWVLTGAALLSAPVAFEQGRAPGPNINLDAGTGAAVAAAVNGAAPAPAGEPKPKAKPKAAKTEPKAKAAALKAKPEAPAPAPETKAEAPRKSWIRRVFIGD